MLSAAKIGVSSLTADWSGLFGGDTGKSLAKKSVTEAIASFQKRRDSKEVMFADSPQDPALSQIELVSDLAKSLSASAQFTDCLFLGIGGSSLGPIALLEALAHRIGPSALRVHFLENPDTTDWRLKIKNLNPESTLVTVVTKSGGTFETLALFLLALEWLGEKRVRSHVVAITDPVKGELRKICQDRNLRTLNISPAIGGRYSVFTPVGLFPMALSGLDLKSFLEGAKVVAEAGFSGPHEKNPLICMAQLILGHLGKTTHVFMPYSSRLKSFAQWIVQLWGESLGKDGLGFSPIAAVGANDQHSLLQLLRDGPNDKVTFFFSLERQTQPVRIPNFMGMPRGGNLDLLQGITLDQLLESEQVATARVLAGRSRPFANFRIKELNEFCMGQLMMSLCLLTTLVGEMLGINPFDQPGVEEGKIYTQEMLRTYHREVIDREDSESAVRRLRSRDGEG